LFAVIFLGGWNGPAADSIPILGFVYLMIKTTIVYFLGLLVRFSLPRFRIDQMMALNWKVLVPLSLATLMLTAIFDKLAPAGNLLVQVIVLVLVNLIIWLLLQEFLARAFRDKPQRRAVLHSRPQADAAEDAPAQPQTDAMQS
jgi:NADH-quinone oxidoreductase subunit H